MKINIAHDSLNYHNLYESTKDNRYRTASQWLEFSFEYPTIKTVDHFLNTDERFVYEIGTHNGPKYWCITPDGKHNIFDYIPKKIIRALHTGQCALHIDQTMEAFPLHEYLTTYNDPRPVDYYKSIHNFLHTNKIKPKQLIFSTSNLLEHDLYDTWCKKNKQNEKFNIVSLPYFACATQQRGFFDLIDKPDTGDDPHDVSYADQMQYKKTNTIQNFNCLNRVERVHRYAFISMLNYYNLIDNNIVSHNVYPTHIKDFIMMERWPDHPAWQKENVHDTAKILPLVYDMKDFKVNYAQNFNEQIYKKTWFSLITETFYQEPCPVVFFSEKIFKPMRAHHPFVIVGHHNSIKWLKNTGFMTFDKWWDESYDDIENPTERMQKICELLLELKKYDQKQWEQIYSDMQTVLEHNYKKLIETDWYSRSYQKVIGNIWNGTFTK